ncbi:hypothetical protein M422DRAFT_161539 [Sphaerobolus stellatus SS14]|nr:hypothetical protein M422DRAFT_161539 [Sphaerobolus stellatus SS14]
MTSNNPCPPADELPPRPPRSESLAGNVQYHTSYLLLHTREPATAWPSVFTSQLYKNLLLRMKEINGLVNFVWLGQDTQEPVSNSEESYSATLWERTDPTGLSKRFDIPRISESNVDVVFDPSLKPSEDVSSGPYFYICVHQNRDCRCGVRGGNLARDLSKELEKRSILFDPNGQRRIGEVGHVGGHKNAPNVLMFPYGDWYGNLEASGLSGLVDYYAKALENDDGTVPLAALNGPNPLQWRGRMGMTKEQQLEAFKTYELGTSGTHGCSGLL